MTDGAREAAWRDLTARDQSVRGQWGRAAFGAGFDAGVVEGIRQAREGMTEEFEEPLTYQHPHTGEWITSKRLRRFVTEWEDVDALTT